MEHEAVTRPGVCCVIGAGDATGAAVARELGPRGLHRQPRDAWIFELDLRPSVETR